MKLNHAAVLFVEDEPLLRETMGRWLQQQVGHALCAEHGEAALAILAAHRIDLLLSDVRMPVMDRIVQVRKLPALASPPRAILVTGFSDLTLRQAYAMGVDAIVENLFTVKISFASCVTASLIPQNSGASQLKPRPASSLSPAFPVWPEPSRSRTSRLAAGDSASGHPVPSPKGQLIS